MGASVAIALALIAVVGRDGALVRLHAAGRRELALEEVTA
jgi:hypothetical protein